jgi:hypothetical protein
MDCCASFRGRPVFGSAVFMTLCCIHVVREIRSVRENHRGRSLLPPLQCLQPFGNTSDTQYMYTLASHRLLWPQRACAPAFPPRSHMISIVVSTSASAESRACSQHALQTVHERLVRLVRADSLLGRRRSHKAARRRTAVIRSRVQRRPAATHAHANNKQREIAAMSSASAAGHRRKKRRTLWVSFARALAAARDCE